jgi:hypothetical protein
MLWQARHPKLGQWEAGTSSNPNTTTNPTQSLHVRMILNVLIHTSVVTALHGLKWVTKGSMKSFVMTGMNFRLVPLPRGMAKAEGRGRGQLYAE